MGYEWHDRLRGRDGRFMRHRINDDQIHIRLPRAEADEIRGVAAGLEMEVGTYCRKAIMAHLGRDTYRDTSGT